jgi:G3E family GTPase
MAEITPVTVLTGFLGAGKTTLLNHLLRLPMLARSVVLMNEFGEIGLDHRLVEKLDSDRILLNTGCLCCTVRGDLTRVLRELLPRARRDDIDRVIIETTGLADPVPVLATLLRDPVAASAYRLDGIVTVVDAVNGMAQLDAQPEAVRQVAIADRIVLSKTDLADAADLRARLRRLNPSATVIPAIFGNPSFEQPIDEATLLRTSAFDVTTKIPEAQTWLADEWTEVPTEHDHGHDPNRHDARIQSFCLTYDAPLKWAEVRRRLQALVAAHGENLLRLKGILSLEGQDRPVALHAVQHLLHPPIVLSQWAGNEDRTSRMVFITRDVPRGLVEAILRPELAETALERAPIGPGVLPGTESAPQA